MIVVYPLFDLPHKWGRNARQINFLKFPQMLENKTFINNSDKD